MGRRHELPDGGGRRFDGDSLLAVRFLPAVAGALKVVLTGLIVRELGGKRVAQGLAALAVAIATVYLSIDHLLTMNVFEPLFWMGCALVLIRMIKTRDARLWLWFGVLAGLRSWRAAAGAMAFGGDLMLTAAGPDGIPVAERRT